ncbi:hypothetical protein WN55_08385 [Dufourea novaeangliae]|uniref:Uncharacterized protein n=1 Tax=Dufourea novaeangliae TaxID=178035 RepID=A0A154P705_DUFNO|nr:hypothetical protein WN55_08385 [Dufourea novaeangliae]
MNATDFDPDVTDESQFPSVFVDSRTRGSVASNAVTDNKGPARQLRETAGRGTSLRDILAGRSVGS